MRFILFILFLCIRVVSGYFFISWDELHRVRNIDDFHLSVRRVIEEFPCEECRVHFEDLVNTHMIPLDSVHSVEEAKLWLWLAHNSINQRIGKPWFPLSVLDQYENSCGVETVH